MMTTKFYPYNTSLLIMNLSNVGFMTREAERPCVVLIVQPGQ